MERRVSSWSILRRQRKELYEKEYGVREMVHKIGSQDCFPCWGENDKRLLKRLNEVRKGECLRLLSLRNSRVKLLTWEGEVWEVN